MPSIVKPVVTHPGLDRNALGLTIRDYEGGMSTLCAGCGHDSVTAAITHALWESDTPPHMIAKLSGIGCSSKTPAYFVNGAHGLNSAHGRMPPIATGATADFFIEQIFNFPTMTEAYRIAAFDILKQRTKVQAAPRRVAGAVR